MTFEEFIKNHEIELTLAQHAFIDWLEKCKKKGLNPYNLKGRGRI